MFKKRVLGCVAALGVALVGCGDQSIELPGALGDSSAILEVFQENARLGAVDMATLQSKVVEIPQNDQTLRGIAIADVIQEAAGIHDTERDAFLARYLCDYESDDGFRPSSKGDRCPPLPCTETVRTYYQVDLGGLFYSEDAPGINGCYRLKNVHKVLLLLPHASGDVTPPEGDTPEKTFVDRRVTIVLDGVELGTVQLSDLSDKVETIEGHEAIKASEMIRALKPDFALETAICDYVADDGWRPSNKAECQEVRSCTFAEALYFPVYENAKNKLFSGADDRTCYEVKGFDRIEITTVP